MSSISSVSMPAAYQPPKAAPPPAAPRPQQAPPQVATDSDGDNDGSGRVNISA